MCVRPSSEAILADPNAGHANCMFLHTCRCALRKSAQMLPSTVVLEGPERDVASFSAPAWHSVDCLANARGQREKPCTREELHRTHT
eukprot:CAMPEP_0171070304 /NCGR_PEP_ID=MMETSP0766_2-20121228/9661_1 /TAXON_ID=439317 /ORGANISM="Gambierdiscus australes, Strain CAWD 149" /LENGTH=86 /DNA_ID=CAMNT_0011526757 /DNA_START=55 /DNA_END=311 /DNA_ORIENTATION=-